MKKEWRVFDLKKTRKCDRSDAFKSRLNSLSTEVGFNIDTLKREYLKNRFVSLIGGVNS